MGNDNKKSEKRKFEDLSLFEQEHRTMAALDRALKRLPRPARSRVLDYLLRVSEEEVPMPNYVVVEPVNQEKLPFDGAP